MAIDTFKLYCAKMKHPLYIKITKPEQNDYSLFTHYEIRVPDEENGEKGPYNYVHESILVGKQVVEWQEVPDLLKAYSANTRDEDVAMDRIHPAPDGEFSAEQEVVVLTFLRKDKAKELILSDDYDNTPQSIESEELDQFEN